ncbi:heavy metal-binding domain-containing protein [Sphingobacterium sp. DR205]|uniref:heavy metal-binding domain-containing protein n=1 Tax=Sphingobacterium sp. DR205 TaxID=2713573 RepID=UPI0013E41D83|nr:heavy metal-binding domain-containing protein [Sphingobacterium sp. DR205]QIH34139.1 heavy metal-binding domain-containing protein [Sphingobacterium sp. DR205]
MIVTTTNSIEGREISRYNHPIVTNVVIGTTVFSDIGTRYVGFFGGRSTSYEKKMEEMFKPSHLFQWKFGKFRANKTATYASVVSL